MRKMSLGTKSGITSTQPQFGELHPFFPYTAMTSINFIKRYESGGGGWGV